MRRAIRRRSAAATVSSAALCPEPFIQSLGQLAEGDGGLPEAGVFGFELDNTASEQADVRGVRVRW
ncbi:MAG TPA: hypothetical protein VJ813_19640 [Vicinamibacterales bacterium]|nr:hypothetical protein [Vicinamibacterales bacterium]